jgi:ADP-ribose pyrophosphatase YjhB (NUDIX family)
MTAQPTLAALAVVIHNDQVLLVQRGKALDHGLWGVPGGHVDPGETALRAAERELLEETGITATAQRYLTNVDVIRHGPDGDLTFHYLLAAVLCAYGSGDPVAGDDAMDARWVPCADVLSNQLPLSEGVPEVLALAHT